TYANIGASSFALGQFREAADAYRQALKLDENNPETQYAYGLALNKLNRTEEEILAYRRAIAAKPDHLNALDHLGQALFKQKRWAEA
ncbi:tetratricopeptide repeat protein, partial [Escherichia coli]|nr:tetratricopeptide repeat protein [Escherichia coli]